MANQLYEVRKPIYYKNPASPRYKQIVKPGDEPVDLPHLTEIDIALLTRTGTIRPIKKEKPTEEPKNDQDS